MPAFIVFILSGILAVAVVQEVLFTVKRSRGERTAPAMLNKHCLKKQINRAAIILLELRLFSILYFELTKSALF